jgi:uncharacterized protein DUF3866
LLKLRRGVVVRSDPLTVRVAGQERPAWADEGLVGEMREGDDVIVNTEALDLGLGSGGFDVVHANLTRGLRGKGAGGAAAMKLNYTSLQHSVEPVETWRGDGVDGDDPTAVRRIPVLVIALHGQLAPAVWAARRARPRMRIGYVQTGGGALPGALSEDVAELRGTELICGQITVSPAHGGEHEAITVIGALRAAAGPLGWDAVIAGPGPGIIGSGTPHGNGGLAALDTAHASLALGLETLLAPRMSEGDPRARHRGLSHHTETVLRLLLRGVRVPAPAPEGRFSARNGDGPDGLGRLRAACGERHELWVRKAPVDEYAASGLPSTTMGREIGEDRLFYAAALAAGDALAAAAPVEAAR